METTRSTNSKSVWYHTDALFVGFRLVRPRVIPSIEDIEKYWPSEEEILAIPSRYIGLSHIFQVQLDTELKKFISQFSCPNNDFGISLGKFMTRCKMNTSQGSRPSKEKGFALIIAFP